jgi:hypothetical protein
MAAWAYLGTYVICGYGFYASIGFRLDYCAHIDHTPRMYHYHSPAYRQVWDDHKYLDSWTDFQNLLVTYYEVDEKFAFEDERTHVSLTPNSFTSSAKGKLLARVRVVNGSKYAEQHRPLLFPHAWKNLTRGERSDVLRYLNLVTEGGVYSDSNVRLRVLMEDWLSRYHFDSDEAVSNPPSQSHQNHNNINHSLKNNNNRTGQSKRDGDSIESGFESVTNGGERESHVRPVESHDDRVSLHSDLKMASEAFTTGASRDRIATLDFVLGFETETAHEFTCFTASLLSMHLTVSDSLQISSLHCFFFGCFCYCYIVS